MAITFDPAKREATLQHRRLDFVDADKVFGGVVVEYEDDRYDYGEGRMVTIGLLYGSVIVVVWTERGRSPRHLDA